MLRFKTDGVLPEALRAQARVTGRSVQIKSRDAAEVEEILGALRLAQCPVEDLEIGRADLEDVFLEIMQEHAANTGAAA
jgi:ABC-2 type transport system ATP-binding protein